MAVLALSDLLGAAVRDHDGAVRGRIRELAIAPQAHLTRVAHLVVHTPDGDRVVSADSLKSCGRIIRTLSLALNWPPHVASDTVLLLKRDLLDQQIIDVHGRKVVRVNDVELEATTSETGVDLHIVGVDVGARGAIRRLARGIVPAFTLRAFIDRIPPRAIPWQFVDLIEADPARRVKLKIAYEGLSRLHPADIADIVEDLPPADREGVFETLDEEVAAEALEEVEPQIQVSIVESLDSGRAADIVGEMDPDAAADLLADLPEDRSGRILEEMGPEERQEVSELLSFGEHTAAGRMTTEFVAAPEKGRVEHAIVALKEFEGSREALATIYLTGVGSVLVGAVPLVSIAVSSPSVRLSDLMEPPVSCVADTPDDEVAALFDKYNLITLAVVDDDGRLVGIITADDVIAMLRQR